MAQPTKEELQTRVAQLEKQLQAQKGGRGLGNPRFSPRRGPEEAYNCYKCEAKARIRVSLQLRTMRWN